MSEQKAREWWIVLNRHYEAIWRYKNAAELDAAAYPPSAVIHVREVLPGPSVEELQAEVVRLRKGLEQAVKDLDAISKAGRSIFPLKTQKVRECADAARRSLSGEGDKA